MAPVCRTWAWRTRYPKPPAPKNATASSTCSGAERRAHAGSAGGEAQAAAALLAGVRGQRGQEVAAVARIGPG